MWNGEEDSLRAFRAAYEVTGRQAKALACTAEHLVAAQDGGKSTAKNIVAACHVCNRRRHPKYAKLSADDYRALVAAKVSEGKWHPLSYYKVIGRRAHDGRNLTPSKSPPPTSRSVPRDTSGNGAQHPTPP